SPLRAKRTSSPPAPRPAKLVQLPGRNPEESKNNSLPARSHARRADRPRRSAKPHPTAADETPKSFPPPAESKSPSKPPALRQTLQEAPPAQSKLPTDRSAGNTRPPDAPRAAASRSSILPLLGSSTALPIIL